MKDMENLKEFRITRRGNDQAGKLLKNILKRKNDSNTSGTIKILEEILSMEKFEDGDLALFDEFFAIRKFDSSVAKEAYLEAFVKISAIELIIQNEIRKEHLRNSRFTETLDSDSENPLIFSSRKAHVRANINSGIIANKHLFSESSKPFSQYKAYTFAKNYLNLDDSRIFIFAYLICIDKDILYSGSYETFYILDYLLKDPGMEKEVESDSPILSDSININDEISPLVQTTEFSEVQLNEVKNRKVRHSQLRNADQQQLCNESIRSKILVKWAENCIHSCKSTLFPLEIESFFFKEILMLNDFNSLIKIIKAKKSHEILYLRLKLILIYLTKKQGNFQRRKVVAVRADTNDASTNESSTQRLPSESVINVPPQSNKNGIIYYLKWIKQSIIDLLSYPSVISFAADLSSKPTISQSTKFLASIIIDSFSNYTPYTECILIDLNSEYITNQLIYKTGVSIPCFYDICSTVDPLYIECLNICMDKLDLMNDEQFVRVVNSPLFKVYDLEHFKNVVNRLKQLDKPLPINNLLRKTKNLKYLASKDKNTSNNSSFCWKIELIRRINYIIDDLVNKKTLIIIAERAITKKNIDLSILLVFKIKSFYLFKKAFNHLLSNYTEMMISIKKELIKKEFSVFYYRVMKFLIKNGHVDSFEFTDCSSYFEALKRKLIEKVKIKKDLALKKLELENTIPKKCSIENKSLVHSNDIINGLYFNNSYFKIENPHKKFILTAEFIIYKETLKDMVLIKFGDNLSLEIVNSDIMARENGNLRKLKALDSQIQNTHIECTGEVNTLSKSNFSETSKQIKLPIDPNTMQKSKLVYAISNFNFSNLLADSGKSAFTPITLKFKFVNTGKNIRVEMPKLTARLVSSSKIEFIKINETFYGVLKSLLYAETTEIVPEFLFGCSQNDGEIKSREVSLFKNSVIYFNDFIKPIDKLLEYKGRKGVYLDRKGMFYLGKYALQNNYVKKHNILEI